MSIPDQVANNTSAYFHRSTDHLPYIPVAELLAGAKAHEAAPCVLDAVSFSYRGIKVHVYGCLHGIAGGTNQAYANMVNATIAAAPGLKFGENIFSKIYRGIDVQMQDWLEIPFRDVFRASLSSSATPFRIARMMYLLCKERITKADRFGQQGVFRLQDIGGSPWFHRLSPAERRLVAGFPAPHAYFEANRLRRAGLAAPAAPIFPDRDWSWMELVEPYINIPYRSVHMLEYACEVARTRDVKEISIFVGEIHNSDMAWYVATKEGKVVLDPELEHALAEVADRARQYANRSGTHVHLKRKRLKYLSGATLGAILPAGAYAWIIWQILPLS